MASYPADRKLLSGKGSAELRPRGLQPGRCPWIALGWRFDDDRDCLASFLALESAEVLAGVKPANLFRLADKSQPCGRTLYRLWLRYGEEILADSPLRLRVLRRGDDALLLLAYREELLGRRLQARCARTFLGRCGYAPGGGLDVCLGRLEERVSDGGIPHEIGVFLGYPLKDVAGFIGWNDLPVSCQRLWKIYGKSRRSLELAERYENSRQGMACALAAGVSPAALLGAGGALAA